MKIIFGIIVFSLISLNSFAKENVSNSKAELKMKEQEKQIERYNNQCRENQHLGTRLASLGKGAVYGFGTSFSLINDTVNYGLESISNFSLKSNLVSDTTHKYIQDVHDAGNTIYSLRSEEFCENLKNEIENTQSVDLRNEIDDLDRNIEKKSDLREPGIRKRYARSEVLAI